MIPGSGDCWRHIGVWGDSSCPELATAVHCRNCPVYADAGRSLLDRDAPPGYQAGWTQVLAGGAAGAAAAGRSVIVFEVAGEALALPTSAFREVSDPVVVRRIPHRSNRLLAGLVNVRGEMLLCVALDRLLELDAPAPPAAVAGTFPRLAVVARAGDRWAFPVDQVLGFHAVDPAELEPLPATVAKGPLTFSRGLFRRKERLVSLLDEEPLFEALRQVLREP